MKIEVEFVSRESIKPSSPTPDHLRKFPISLLDQLTPPVYTPIILYYAADAVQVRAISGTAGDSSLASKLKRSLSQALIDSFPLAGRLRDNRYIECNDEGVPFTETRVTNCELSTFLERPDYASLDGLLSRHTICSVPEEEAPHFCVQVNTFRCGGIAIGLSLLHKIIGGGWISQFLNRWASNSKMIDESYSQIQLVGEDRDSKNILDYAQASVLFPSREVLPSNAVMWTGSPFGGEVNSSAERYVFDARAISAIRKKSASETVPNPSSVEALTGFIWMCLLKASRINTGARKPAVLAHAVDIRGRMAPPLPDSSMGNIVWKAFACYDADFSQSEPELPVLVALLRRSISVMDHDYIEKLTNEETGFHEISKWLEEVGRMYSEREPESYSFTSWCRMGFNELDFGWGRPVWVSPGCVVNAPFKNTVVLLKAKQGIHKDDIDVWMILDEKEMKILKQDPEFLDFAFINPSVLPPAHRGKARL